MAQTSILGRGYGAPPQTHPSPRSGASRLRASLGAFGPSIVPPNQKSCIHPWAHPPSQNPGYAHVSPAIGLLVCYLFGEAFAKESQ